MIVDFIKFNNLNDANVSINGIELSFQNKMKEMNNLNYEDMFFLATIDKALKLIDPFCFCLDKKNITVLAILARVQLDCVLRTFASTLVDDSTAFCNEVLVKKVKISNIRDKNNSKMTDKYLCNELAKITETNIYEIYTKLSGFVHFSSYSFNISTRPSDDFSLNMFVGKNSKNPSEEELNRLTLELANSFYYFQNLHLYIYSAWINQMKNKEKQ